MRGLARLIPTLALAAWAQAVSAEWQCNSGAPAAQELLGRAERIYPSQLLGVLRVSGRVLLLNSTDDGWSERVRQGLMELRLAEPDITAARRFQASAGGASAANVPAGEFVCLERARAARHGLTLTAGGNVMLAAGKSVHLVDPHETAIVVEVRATGSGPLDFGEIIAMSGRSGIYAGLAAARPQPAAPVTVNVGSTERLGGEVVVTFRGEEGAGTVGEKVVVATASAALSPPSPVPEPVAATPVPAAPVVEVSPAKPLPPEPSVVVAVAEPEGALGSPREPAAKPQPDSGRSYDEYAKTMKALLAIRRSGSVHSVSEMTYVHPAVEYLRNTR